MTAPDRTASVRRRLVCLALALALMLVLGSSSIGFASVRGVRAVEIEHAYDIHDATTTPSARLRSDATSSYDRPGQSSWRDTRQVGLSRAAEETTSAGWRLGDPIDNLTRAGNEPAWSTVRGRYWKNAANDALDGEYSDANLARMQTGRAPLDEATGQSMELHHIEPRYLGGGNNIENLEPLWPWEHDVADPFRTYNGSVP
jgi:hypothetical protein